MSNAIFTSVTPSDTVALPKPCHTFYIGSTGDIAVLGTRQDGKIDTTPTVFHGVPAGLFRFPGYVSQVLATSTTASQIVAYLPPNDGCLSLLD